MAAGWGLVKSVPSGARNGFPEPGGYVYRGSQPLDGNPCDGGCGRLIEVHAGPKLTTCAVCRGSDYYVRGAKQPTGGGRPKCGECGHELRSASHKRKCGR